MFSKLGSVLSLPFLVEEESITFIRSVVSVYFLVPGMYRPGSVLCALDTLQNKR